MEIILLILQHFAVQVTVMSTIIRVWGCLLLRVVLLSCVDIFLHYEHRAYICLDFYQASPPQKLYI